MESIRLDWHRFTRFIALREGFRSRPCVYLQTDPEEQVLRVGESGDPWGRYRGGTAYALDAALHGSGNLFFAAAAPTEEKERKLLEATLIFDLQPEYNNEHKTYPPYRRIQYVHDGDLPKTLRPSV
jgi:excinuclease UvrABC nuclease subunit